MPKLRQILLAWTTIGAARRAVAGTMLSLTLVLIRQDVQPCPPPAARISISASGGYPFGTVTGEPLKNFRKAWETVLKIAKITDLEIGPTGRLARFAITKATVSIGGPPGDRTRDTVIKSHVLYH